MVLNDYYEILELKRDAGVDDLKKAFRQKAKQYHPDRNSSPHAEEDFIRIHNAYEVVNGFLSSKSFLIFDQVDYAKWAADRARTYAQMKYESFIQECEAYHNSPYAWIFKILYYGLYYLYIFCAMIFSFVPVWAGLEGGFLYFILCLPLFAFAYFTVEMARGWKKEIDPLFN